MAVIYAGYYDESSDDVSFSVAGFIGPMQSWIHLDWAWRDLLTKWNVKYFKASECVQGLEQFAQYRDDPLNVKAPLKTHEWEKLQGAYSDFGNAILKHSDYLIGAGATVPWSDFKRVIGESAKARTYLLDHPYYICLQAVLHAATVNMVEENKVRSENSRLYIKPIFDSHEEFAEIARIAYEKFREKNKRAGAVLLPLRYEDDIDTPALQVADMLAYEGRKFSSNKTRAPDRDMREGLKRLLPVIDKIKGLNYDILKLIVDQQRDLPLYA
jgi:hypothetical protein